ncbi:hypothetical protein GCM10007989_38440 [Devosia pacifica]|uniref:Uncharacterized protein n=1 Tax=Devosia pacifica TaxID=1335967 RepID=A0A918VYZ2_9HYPH|nr:hypothetical protein [Devosia pacifica]GHA39007.1 hypothetical protein GCM10007989_38440 [Devosia pacifica]
MARVQQRRFTDFKPIGDYYAASTVGLRWIHVSGHPKQATLERVSNQPEGDDAEGQFALSRADLSLHR